MNKSIFEGNFKELKGKLKQKYANLSDDDLEYVEGKEDEFYGRLQTKLGKSKEQVKDLIDKI